MLADPLATTRLLLVWERGQSPRQDRLGAVPKKLVEAVKAELPVWKREILRDGTYHWVGL